MFTIVRGTSYRQMFLPPCRSTSRISQVFRLPPSIQHPVVAGEDRGSDNGAPDSSMDEYFRGRKDRWGVRDGQGTAHFPADANPFALIINDFLGRAGSLRITPPINVINARQARNEFSSGKVAFQTTRFVAGRLLSLGA